MVYKIFKNGEQINIISASKEFLINYCIANDYTYEIVEETTSPISNLTHEEINAMVVNKIREKYDINEEFKMINLGISNPEDEQYIAYRTYVNECISWGDTLEAN